MQAVVSLGSTIKFEMCNVVAATLVSGSYSGDCTLRVSNCDLTVNTLDDGYSTAANNSPLTELTLINNRITVTATSTILATRKIYAVNNRFNVSAVSNSTPILSIYPQLTDGFAATVIDITNNEVIGTNSTKLFLSENSNALSNVCVVNFQQNRFSSTDVLALANVYYVRALATGTSAVTNNNYYYVSGTGFGLLT
jgi:hypothetical protein